MPTRNEKRAIKCDSLVPQNSQNDLRPAGSVMRTVRGGDDGCCGGTGIDGRRVGVVDPLLRELCSEAFDIL